MSIVVVSNQTLFAFLRKRQSNENMAMIYWNDLGEKVHLWFNQRNANKLTNFLWCDERIAHVSSLWCSQCFDNSLTVALYEYKAGVSRVSVLAISVLQQCCACVGALRCCVVCCIDSVWLAFCIEDNRCLTHTTKDSSHKPNMPWTTCCVCDCRLILSYSLSNSRKFVQCQRSMSLASTVEYKTPKNRFFLTFNE